MMPQETNLSVNYRLSVLIDIRQSVVIHYSFLIPMLNDWHLPIHPSNECTTKSVSARLYKSMKINRLFGNLDLQAKENDRFYQYQSQIQIIELVQLILLRFSKKSAFVQRKNSKLTILFSSKSTPMHTHIHTHTGIGFYYYMNIHRSDRYLLLFLSYVN